MNLVKLAKIAISPVLEKKDWCLHRRLLAQVVLLQAENVILTATQILCPLMDLSNSSQRRAMRRKVVECPRRGLFSFGPAMISTPDEICA